MESEQEQYQLLTIEEMRELAKTEEYKIPEEELQMRRNDEKDVDFPGGEYTVNINVNNPSLLRDHLLLEECLTELWKLDWKLITHVYNYRAIAYMHYLWYHPLVWVPISDELKKSRIIIGKVAEERYVKRPEEFVLLTPLDWHFNELILIWFADKLPKLEDTLFDRQMWLTSIFDIVLWPYIINDPYPCYRRASEEDGVYDPSLIKRFDLKTFYYNIQHIAELFDGKKAAEIVRLLRSDWKRIVSLKLFEIDKITPEQIEEFRAGLFEGMDYYLERWETETPQPSSPETTPASFEYITDQCRKEGKAEAVEAELRAAAKGTAVAMWKTIRTNEALGYLSTKNLAASKIYKALTAYFGPLPYNERNFRDARNKR